MRFYGKNRARLLGEPTEEQAAFVRKEKRIRCGHCGRLKPESHFGRYATCSRCRKMDAEYKRGKRAAERGKGEE